MNAGNVIALLSILTVVVLTVSGWVVGHLMTRLRTADQLVATQRDTIEDLKRQNQRLEITAELTDRFLTATMPPRTGPGA